VIVLSYGFGTVPRRKLITPHCGEIIMAADQEDAELARADRIGFYLISCIVAAILLALYFLTLKR
jgi:hypothetical protein